MSRGVERGSYSLLLRGLGSKEGKPNLGPGRHSANVLLSSRQPGRGKAGGDAWQRSRTSEQALCASEGRNTTCAGDADRRQATHGDEEDERIEVRA